MLDLVVDGVGDDEDDAELAALDASIATGLDAARAGRVRPAADVFADLRAKRGGACDGEARTLRAPLAAEQQPGVRTMDTNAFLIALSESDRTQFGRVDFAEQPEEHKVVSANWGLESQVNNGGFSQYFRSSDGDAAEFAPSALRTIGARACAALVERALRTVSASPLPTSRRARASAVDSASKAVRDRLEDLDREFFSHPDDSTGLLFSCVARHPDDFGPVPAGRDA